MPGSPTTPGRSGARNSAPDHVAFRRLNSVGTRVKVSFAAQWLACTLPCRRFADILADTCARLGADVVRYAFIVMDLHLLLLAGLPAHSSYYVWYRLQGDPAQARAAVDALQAIVEARTGIAGRLLTRSDDPRVWMEIYEGVADRDAFERALADAVASHAAVSLAADGMRHTECFSALEAPA